jgi:3-hydroxy-3-methylglutaryl-coenzyme A reductase (EC 1.1.1.34)
VRQRSDDVPARERGSPAAEQQESWLVGEPAAPGSNESRRRTDGEHADGEFPIPLATTEETLVAPYGGGTGLATQQECLEMLDCTGSGRVNRFAEIAAATVLAGERSLAAAISVLDWVTSHDELGRTR